MYVYYGIVHPMVFFTVPIILAICTKDPNSLLDLQINPQLYQVDRQVFQTNGVPQWCFQALALFEILIQPASDDKCNVD